MDYISKKAAKKLADNLMERGLVGSAHEVRANLTKITYEKQAQYQSLLIQSIKAEEGIVKTCWETKIVERMGRPDGTPSPDCWFSSNEDNATLAKLEIEHGDKDSVEETTHFGFYTYMGGVCILTSDGYDCDFDAFSEEFQKKAWELVEAGKFAVAV